MTPQSSLFKEESGFGLGVLGEEVYVGSGVVWEGMCGEYLPERSKVGNSRGLSEVDLEHLYSFQCYAYWP